MKKEIKIYNDGLSRRDFVKASTITAGGMMLSSLPLSSSAYAGGNDTLKVALIGCGNRGTGAAGVRRVIEAAKTAKEKGLNIVVGLQRRYEKRYREL